MNPPALADRDEQHLKLLSTFHYVVAALTALFALIPIVHVIIGIIMISAPESLTGGKGQGPPEWFGWLFLSIGSAFILAGMTLAACIFTAGRYIAQRRNYTFCVIVAGLECMMMPFGTVLGIFTLIVLLRDTVKPLFGYASGK